MKYVLLGHIIYVLFVCQFNSTYENIYTITSPLVKTSTPKILASRRLKTFYLIHSSCSAFSSKDDDKKTSTAYYLSSSFISFFQIGSSYLSSRNYV